MEDNNIAEIHERVYVHLTEKYPDVRFYLDGSKSRQEELNQGFWFKGGNDYVEINFQSVFVNDVGITFTISSTGNATLNLHIYTYSIMGKRYNKKLVSFFKNIGSVMGMSVEEYKSSESSYVLVKKWTKTYKGIDYIKNLDIFLKTDKKIIDAFVESSDDEVKSYFRPFNEELFEKEKQNIDRARKKLSLFEKYKVAYEETKSIMLHSLLFENISLFNHLQKIDFHQNLTCIIGMNGAGKTSILRALVLAFTGYNQNQTRALKETTLLTKQLNYLLTITGEKGGKPVYAAQGFTKINYTLATENQKDDTLYQNQVLITSDKNVPRLNDDSDSDFRNIINDRYKSLFLAFPQVQGEVDYSKNYNLDKEYPHIKDAISMLNNVPDNRFGSFADWLCGLHKVANNKQHLGETHPKERILLKKIFEIISEVTQETIRLHEIVVRERGKDTIWVIIGEKTPPILFKLVSQGYNNVFGWIGYFMKRLVEVEPEAADFTKTAGIVLIDEIDTYLHPQWQAQIMAVLVRQFPNVQFIVTTHSPYIVGSIPPDKVKIYICKKQEHRFEVEAFTDFTPYGADLSRLSEKVFGVKGRFVTDVRLKLEQLATLIHKGELAAAKKYLNEQFTDIDADDSELQRSKMLIRTKEILSK